ncbi:MAG: hypothetical protein QGG40_21750, partial [Myxococcota bacterium]|nr:hypothetical protein [Myxococcota bacterium]
MFCLAFSACATTEDPRFGTPRGHSDTGQLEDSGPTVDTALSWAGPCPAGMIYVASTTVELGEWDSEILAGYYPDEIISQFTVEVSPFCMDRFPFPGHPGSDWPIEGLALPQVEEIDLELQGFGRRVCTITELLYAAAGPNNMRYPFDSEDFLEGFCDPDDEHPEALGSYPDCSSILGFRDFQVRSTWGRLDTAMRTHIESYRLSELPGEGNYAVWGGTSRTNTFYAPSNFGFHTHGLDDDSFLDDGFRTCADVGRGSHDLDAWIHWTETFQSHGRYT